MLHSKGWVESDPVALCFAAHSSENQRQYHQKARWRRSCAILAITTAACFASACASGPNSLTTASLAPPPDAATALGQPVTAPSATQLASAPKAAEAASGPETTPADAPAVIAKARQLRRDGNKAEALKTLDGAENAETSKALLTERGMLALELGQLAKAEKLLTRARDQGDANWRLHSALGAALSARGNQQAAQLEFSKALKLAPDHPSILNNLALSYALDGSHDQAEALMRSAVSRSKGSAKSKQNLALLLGLNGNINEAKRISETVLPRNKADANASYFAALKRRPTKVSKANETTAPSYRSAAAASAP